MEPDGTPGNDPMHDNTTQGEDANATAAPVAPSSTSQAAAPPKFSYNMLHYPCYPSYEVLLAKRFKTVPLPPSKDEEELHSWGESSKKRSRPISFESSTEAGMQVEAMDGSSVATSNSAKRRRVKSKPSEHGGDAEPPSKEKAHEGNEEEELLDALQGPNVVGFEPEDHPPEDDGEAEPSQSVEDEEFDLNTSSFSSSPSSSSLSASSSSSSTSSSSSSSSSSTSTASANSTPLLGHGVREGLTRDELSASAQSLDHLVAPLNDLQRSIREVGESLRSHRFHYNLDLCTMVAGIDRHVTELHHQIRHRRRFLTFALSLNRPVQSHMGYFGALPLELVLHVFGFLDGRDLLSSARVCSTFAALANDAHLWKGIVERTWEAEGIYMQKPSHKSFKWLYQCKKRVFKLGETKNGRGSCGGEHGDIYEGEWKDNKRHGVGTALMQDGRRYDGEWENDMRSGFGIFRWPINYAKNGGDLYAGNWKEDQRHGEGTYIWSDGTTYEGQWKEGKREGFGCVVWPDGRKYEGEYKDGKMSGKGTFCWPDGSVYVGEYKEGKRHGEGTYTYSTMMGGVYTGQWRNGMRDGWGKLVKNDGEMYQGVWKFNCPFGGVLTKKDGTVIEKFWRLFPPAQGGGT